MFLICKKFVMSFAEPFSTFKLFLNVYLSGATGYIQI